MQHCMSCMGYCMVYPIQLLAPWAWENYGHCNNYSSRQGGPVEHTFSPIFLKTASVNATPQLSDACPEVSKPLHSSLHELEKKIENKSNKFF